MNEYLNDIKELSKRIENANSVCLISHLNPDGDSLGSLLGFGLALRKKYGNKIYMAIPDNVPAKYSFLPGNEEIMNLDDIGKQELYILLDCSDIYRIGENRCIDANKIINIDHHITNDKYGSINIINPYASSTGEMVLSILESMKLDIDNDIAINLYVAISTDTGSFKYDNTSSSTHIAVSKLLEQNINIGEINTKLYQNKPFEKVMLFIDAVGNIEFYLDNKVGMVTVPLDLIDKWGGTTEYVDGIVEFIRDIDCVEVACVLKETENNIFKLSFRSKTYVDVSKIATIYGGGGHAKASGCTITGEQQDIKKDLLEKIKIHLR